MKNRVRLIVSLLAILALAYVAGYIDHPKGSRIDLGFTHIPWVKNFKKDLPVSLGLDLQGGSHLVYQADFKDVKEEDRADALEAVRSAVERRVTEFDEFKSKYGVTEPVVQSQGGDKIVVELPGVKNVNDAIELIGQTPFLEFKTFDPNFDPNAATVSENGVVSQDITKAWKSTGLTGKQLKKATAENQNSAGVGSEYVVKLVFNDEGKELFKKITSENINKQVAIFLDGKVLSAPTVQTAITDGTAIISGSFKPADAIALAKRLNSGALPVPIKIASQSTVGASLGTSSVQDSVTAGLLGLLLVAIFMIAFYRLPGVLSVAALVVYTLVCLAALKLGVSILAIIIVGGGLLLGITVSWWFGLIGGLLYILLFAIGQLTPVTLTLAGIAGFILSVGMAVDANILIFERMKEEVHAGKDIDKAIADGFSRAWTSIRDSNVSSLITTIILYQTPNPSIKSFALALGIGIIISMFTAITITRTLLETFLVKKITRIPWLFGVTK